MVPRSWRYRTDLPEPQPGPGEVRIRVAPAPLELIGGQLIVAEPQGSDHASVVGMVADVIRAALPVGLVVRVQMPIALDDGSEPEPDVAVVSGAHEG